MLTNNNIFEDYMVTKSSKRWGVVNKYIVTWVRKPKINSRMNSHAAVMVLFDYCNSAFCFFFISIIDGITEQILRKLTVRRDHE